MRGKKWIIYLLAFTFSVFLLRMMNPQYVKYVLFPLVPIVAIFALIEFCRNFKTIVFDKKLIIFLPIFLLFAYIIIAVLLSDFKRELFYKDILNTLIVLPFILSLLFLLPNLSTFDRTLTKFRQISLWICTIAAIFGIVKYVLSKFGIIIDFLKADHFGYPPGTSLAVDENFYALACIVTFILLLFTAYRTKSQRFSIGYQLLMLVVLLSAFLTSSRRGFIVSTLTVATICITIIISFFVKKNYLRVFRRKTIFLISIFLLSFVASIIYFNHFETEKRDKLVKSMRLPTITVKDLIRISNERIQEYINNKHVNDSLKTLQLSDSLTNTNDSVLVPDFNEYYASDPFAGIRVDLIRYSLHLYKYNYNTVQKLFGNKFDYLQQIVSTFSPNTADTDYVYPHNPFCSVLLYSGLIGLLIYLWFIVFAIYYYWKYRRKYWAYGLCFGACFVFTFFSCSTPFEPSICGIFAILPYFIHYYNSRSIKNL